MPDAPRVTESTKLTSKNQDTASHWGLASLLLGGLLAVMAMLWLQMNLPDRTLFFRLGDDVRAIVNLGAVILGVTTITSIAFGISSLVVAHKRAQSCALGWAGLLVSTLALLMWILTLHFTIM